MPLFLLMGSSLFFFPLKLLFSIDIIVSLQQRSVPITCKRMKKDRKIDQYTHTDTIDVHLNGTLTVRLLTIIVSINEINSIFFQLVCRLSLGRCIKGWVSASVIAQTHMHNKKENRFNCFAIKTKWSHKCTLTTGLAVDCCVKITWIINFFVAFFLSFHKENATITTLFLICHSISHHLLATIINCSEKWSIQSTFLSRK